MDPAQVSLFRVKFIRSFGNHIAIPHTSQDSTARVVETWTRMGQSYQWRQWKGHQRLGTGNGTDRYGRVNRLVGGTGLGDTMELHVFCDASLEATAAVAYIKTTGNQETTTRFLMGKTRVAPLRQTTIPRLELQAALYAARLKKTIEDEMDFKFDKIFLWSDSTTVLSWIKNFKLKHKMYIGNRIAEIRDLTNTNQWNYVNTKDNPADQGTRGLTATEMTEKSFWLQGPHFLLSSSDISTTEEQQHETVFLKSAEQKPQGTRRQPIDKDLIDANRFSQWLKLRAVIIKMKNLRNTGPADHRCRELSFPSISATIIRGGHKSTGTQQANSKTE